MASAAGLAPARFGLKGRSLDLLCIHGLLSSEMTIESGEILNSSLPTRHLKWSPRLVSRQRLLVFSEALICLSYSGDCSPSRSSASEGWSSRQVMLLRLPVISRVLCF